MFVCTSQCNSRGGPKQGECNRQQSDCRFRVAIMAISGALPSVAPRFLTWPHNPNVASPWVVGLLTGHCHLKGHLTDDPICERCLEEDESATHILCDCEAVAHIRFRHLGQVFMEPSDYYDAPIDKVLHFIRGVGLIKG
jgi:hypothetical protein